MSELKKFLVILRPGSGAAEVIGTDFDATYNGMPVLTCSAVDTTGTTFATIRRVPSSKAAMLANQGHQTWWFHTHDIAAVFQYDGSQQQIGFIQK